nr:MAG TPA: hypothetical protein [Caudoviricetes sp.]
MKYTKLYKCSSCKVLIQLSFIIYYYTTTLK